MLARIVWIIVFLFIHTLTHSQVTARFTAPDTVFVNSQVKITNTSTNATTCYWNFGTENSNTVPYGKYYTIDNDDITSPVYIDYVQEDGNYYGFVTNNWKGKLVRLDFGNSLLNTPKTYSFDNLDGAIVDGVEGIQVIKNEGKWYAMLVGGTIVNGDTPRIVKLDFGESITNTSPIATNWGNIGNMAYPHDLHMFNEGGTWYGITINSDSSTITRFNFTNSFNNVPTAENLGNIGGLSAPTGMHAVNENGHWYAFITNAKNSTISRLDFGNSLLNTPTGINLGNIDEQLHDPFDIQFIKYDDGWLAYVINANQSYNNLIKLNFKDITGTPTATDLSNVGHMNFPHSLSKLFREGQSLYSFVPNVSGQSITRLRFADTTNLNLPPTTKANPGLITYSKAGTYQIKLFVDDALPTQTTYCKQIVVVLAPGDTSYQQDAANQSREITDNRFHFSPVVTNMGNPGNLLSNPVFMDYVYDKGNYYAFVVNYNPAKLVRLDYGNSLLNTPQAVNLGNYGGILPTTSIEGIQVVQHNGKWYALIVGGNAHVNLEPRIVKIDFGANITSAGTATNWGNRGNMNQPIDLYVFKEGKNWYGLTVNAEFNNITRFNFSNNFERAPTTVNLGNIGGLQYPTGMFVINDNGVWRVFITNAGDNQRLGTRSSLTRLDFGSSLLNTPTGVNLGNPGKRLLHPRDLTIMKFCGNMIGIAINGNPEVNNMVLLNFGNSLTNKPTISLLGATGDLDFPHSISKVFRVKDELYAFITNVENHTITRLMLSF